MTSTRIPKPARQRRPAPRARALAADAAAESAAFRAHIDAVRTEVDLRLDRLWDDTLREVAPNGAAVVTMADAARQLTMRGGKRFRAAMVFAAFSGVRPRGSREGAWAAAVAIELLQSYLLMQDDWMDGDAVRRGGPSAHAALAAAWNDAHLGASSAILAGDLTWGLAVRTLVRAPTSAARRLAAIDLLCGVHQDVVAGQQLDMLGRAEDVELMHALKTGSYTVRGPLLFGATLGGAADATLRALAKYAAPLGIAFQLRDDLLGAFAPEAVTGKRAGNDLRMGKRTAVWAEAERLLGPEDRAIVDLVWGHADASEGDVARAVAAFERCGARAAVETRLFALCDEAAALARKLPLSDPARRCLAGAAAALRGISDASPPKPRGEGGR